MNPNEIYFCVASLEEMERDFSEEGSEYNGVNIITFCPVAYWKEHECLPDYYFSDQIDDSLLPTGYQWYIFVEECQWATKKFKEEILKDLTSAGFIHNLGMESFLSSCY